MKRSSEVVSFHLKVNKGKPSPALVRLWRLLLASRKDNPPGTHEAASDKKYEDENDKAIGGG